MKRIILLMLVGIFCMTTSAVASGFGVFVQGAEGLAQGNAVIAHAAGASTVYFNPALMTQLEGAGLEIGTTMVQSDRSFTSDLTGQTTDANDSTYFPSTFYFYSQIPKLETFWFGLAVNSTFGLGTSWPDDWEGRYIATKNEFTTFNINPNIAWKLNNWSVAIGLDFLYMDIDSNRAIPLGGTDGYQQISGDTWSYGYNVALAWQPTDKLGFGLSYRSKFDVDFNSLDVTHSIIAPPLLPNTTGTTKFALPQQLTFGVAYDFTPKLVVEVAARWEDWSQYGNTTIYLQDPVFGQSSETIMREWQSTMAYSIGGKYSFTPKWSVLAGYLYSETCVPDSTFDPSIPDTNAHLYTVGVTYERPNWSFDFAYGLQAHEDRNKTNDINGSFQPIDPSLWSAKGLYKGTIHLFSASVGYDF